MQPLIFRDKQKVNSYYEVPDEIIADKRQLIKWARESIQCRLSVDGIGQNRKEAGDE